MKGTNNGNGHGLQTPNEAFFHQNPKRLSLGKQLGQINFGAFGVFSANLLAPTSVLWDVGPLSMSSIDQPLFLQKTKPLYRNPKYIYRDSPVSAVSISAVFYLVRFTNRTK